MSTKQKPVKGRTSKTSPNTAGPARREAQKAAAARNKDDYPKLSPWEKAKHKRKIARNNAGKPAAWLKKQETASNYKSNGKNAVKDGATYSHHEVNRYPDMVS